MITRRRQSHPCSTGIGPTRYCWRVQETQTWTQASRPGRTGWSAGSSSAAGWGERPDRQRRVAESPSAGECGGNWRSNKHTMVLHARLLRPESVKSVRASVPAYGVKLLEELVHSGMIIITLSSDQIKSSAVLRADLLQQVVRHFLSLKHKKSSSSSS